MGCCNVEDCSRAAVSERMRRCRASRPDCCASAFLVIVNVIMLLLGIVSLFGGLFLKFGQTTIVSELQSTLGASVYAQTVTDAYDLTMFDVAAYVLIGVGVFAIAVAVVGYVGACCSFRVLLIVYVVIVLLMFLVKLIMLIVFATHTLTNEIFASLLYDLKTKYAGPTALNPESLTLNIIMFELQCCGIKTYEEFLQAEAWNRTMVVERGGNTYVLEQRVPVTCCKVTGTFPDITPVDENCTWAPTLINANPQNCYQALLTELEDAEVALYGTYAAVLTFEVLCASVAICLLVRMRHQDSELGGGRTAAKNHSKVHPEQKKKTDPVVARTGANNTDPQAQKRYVAAPAGTDTQTAPASTTNPSSTASGKTKSGSSQAKPTRIKVRQPKSTFSYTNM